MNHEANLRVSSLARLSPQLNQSPIQPISHEAFARHKTSAFWLIPCLVLAVVALAFAADAIGQKPHPGVPYNGPDATYPSGQSAQQNPQSTPQNDYAPPQVQQPYAQAPQSYPDPQPQYAPQQPQYAPQYSAPQQPYSQQQYEPQPYPDQQPNSEQAPPDDQQDQNSAPAQALSAEDLEQLLAPIALYPDSLLAQILAASTYPAQVAIADQWVQQMRAAGYSSPDQIAAGANAQANWDPSVKALTAFPDVLDLLNHDLEWTTNLGNAYYNQPQDVMQTVQVLRDRAEQAGNLQSTPQEEVQNDQGYIDLAPTDPQDVYVPTYNPWDVYGEPIAPYPGFSFVGALGDFFGGVPIQYGLSFALGAFDRMPFGWFAWGCDWRGNGLMFNHSGYYTHSRQVADWGLPRGGPRAYGRGGSWGGRENSYDRANGGRQGYDRGGGDRRGGWPDNSGGAGGSGGRDGRGGAQSYVRPAQGFPEPGRSDYSGRGYPNRNSQQPGYEYTHPSMPSQGSYRTSPGYSRPTPQQNYGYRPQTYPNRAPAYTNPGYSNRPQSYSNPGSRYGYTGRSNYGYTGPQNYATRPGFTYSNPSGSYRAPQQDYSRGSSNRSYENYGNTAARNERSGGFHLFGGGQPRSFSNQRAPSYSYQAPRNFGGGHQNFGGGHSNFGGGHESAPRMSHSGGSGGNHRR